MIFSLAGELFVGCFDRYTAFSRRFDTPKRIVQCSQANQNVALVGSVTHQTNTSHLARHRAQTCTNFQLVVVEQAIAHGSFIHRRWN